MTELLTHNLQLESMSSVKKGLGSPMHSGMSTPRENSPSARVKKLGVDFDMEQKDKIPQLQVPEKMLHHNEMLQAVMIDMMPGIMAMCCSTYTADIVKAYFRRVRAT